MILHLCTIQFCQELFYMVKGSMCLKIKERGQPRNIDIKEGEIFLLPSRIPHSPQRFADTCGLVIERLRYPQEFDCLKWYNKDEETIYEEYFNCTDLGQALVPIIKRYQNSEQFKTQKPIESEIVADPPIKPNYEISVGSPFLLREWIENYKLSGKTETGEIFGEGEFVMKLVLDYDSFKYNKETWLWQWEGQATIEIGTEDTNILLKEGDSYLIPKDMPFKIQESKEGSTFVITNRK